MSNAGTDLRVELQEQLGDTYLLDRELPRGGMSRVFVGVEAALGRQVVLKVLAPELSSTLSAERFKREIALAAHLQHPNIVPLLSAAQAGVRLYYTMPLVDGESLRERMARERPMSVGSVSRILEDIAGALAYAHGEGIVHRDMKPENVMFFHGRAVVLDFGIGKALTAALRNDGEMRITQAGVSLGTPMYIAPEQAAGDPSLDHRADLYAVGVLAYEMLTGHPPFSGATPQAVMAAHATERPTPISAKRPDLPPPLARIIMKCLAKRPEDRPQNAEEIIRAVREAEDRAEAPTGTSRIPPWVPWVVAAVSTAAAIALAFKRPL